MSNNPIGDIVFVELNPDGKTCKEINKYLYPHGKIPSRMVPSNWQQHREGGASMVENIQWHLWFNQQHRLRIFEVEGKTESIVIPAVKQYVATLLENGKVKVVGEHPFI